MRSILKLFLLLALPSVLLFSCGNHNTDDDVTPPPPGPTTPVINYTVGNFYLHDTALFTEGFLVHEGNFFESTGSPDGLPDARSMIGISDAITGKFVPKVELDRTKYFGEGIVFLKNRLYQLTYLNQKGFIYDAKTFKQLDTFHYANKEGWSLTTNGTDLIMSDGTDVLTYLSPDSLKPTRLLKITENGAPRDSLNELEYIKGYIYANIWINNCIVKIDPANGNVVGKLDMGSLVFEARTKNPKADVLNGIAYDSTNDKIFVTGKKWTNIYEIKFSH
jgi:glutaminyl-peptide cyclotransferase